MKISDSQLRILEKSHIECPDVSKLLGEYADGELIISLKERVEEHIGGCASCRKDKNDYMQVINIARSLRNNSPLPEGVKARLQASLNSKLGISIEI